MTTAIFYQQDVYEISFTPEGVNSIVKYRDGLNGRGELVDYDQLHPHLQEVIFNRLKNELERTEES